MAFKLPLGKKTATEQTPEVTILDTSQDTPPIPIQKKEPASSPISQRMRPPGLFFGLMAVVTAILIIYEGHQSSNATIYVAAAGEMRMLSQQIAKSSLLALQGNPQAFRDLSESSNRFSSLLTSLNMGGIIDDTEVPAVPDSSRPPLQELIEAWDATKQNADNLLNQEKKLLMLNTAVKTITESNERLLDLTEQIAALTLQSGGSTAEINTINRAAMLTQRIAKNANTLLIANAIDPKIAFSLSEDSNDFRNHINQLEKISKDTEIQHRLEKINEPANAMLAAVADIENNLQLLVRAKDAGKRIFEGNADSLLETTSLLTDALSKSTRGFNLISVLITLSTLLGLGALGLMAKIYNTDLSDRRTEAEAQRQNAENERNLTQQAILRLMNEMGDLADGDLTIRATVTEDITGAIADSVNYTIEELSVLVRRINDAATRVTAATQSAQQTSNELLDATERQTHEINEAGETIQRMAQFMIESSDRARQSAQVARRSLESARKGADAVENTIKGMNEIRGKIQDTSKRIKRLGESSQEIGEIVELISDITEQTNVLALNAAIQAASAGDAGRGFTVVAEEVQRLAERSGEATKQIAAIVKTIQTDTQDAISAMENATRDVVEGAELSDAAGQALSEIGQVSTETAHLIERISADTQEQASTATQVAETMKSILAITEQTTLGTQKTAVSIGQLADLAIELKGSVSGFKV